MKKLPVKVCGRLHGEFFHNENLRLLVEQLLGLMLRLAGQVNPQLAERIDIHLRAVSYTHLDVYKRQAWICVR